MRKSIMLALAGILIFSFAFAINVSINSSPITVNKPDESFAMLKITDQSTVVHNIQISSDFVKVLSPKATFIGTYSQKLYFNGKYGTGNVLVVIDKKEYTLNVSFVNPWVEDSLIVSNIKGQVLVQKSGKKSMRPLFIGAKVKEGDLVLSLESGYVKFKLKSTQEIVELGPLSQMYVESLKYHKDEPTYKNVVINVFKGKERNDLFKGLKEGSKFQIKGPSATAGVRGTKFTVAVDDKGNTKIQVERGKVEVTPSTGGNPIMVLAGNQVMVQTGGIIGKIQKITNPESLQPKPEKSKPTASSTSTSKTKEEKPSKKEGNNKMGMNTGTTTNGTETYYMLTLNPNLHNIFGTGIGLGLDITLGIDKNKNLVYGTTASTNILSAFNLRWFEYKNKNILIHYGEMEPINYDYGLLMSNYYKKGLKGLELGLSDLGMKGYSLQTCLPWDIESIYPFEFNPTSTLYSGKLTLQLNSIGLPLPLQLELTGVYESDKNLANMGYPYGGMAAAISWPISVFFTPYAEYATLMASGTTYKNFEKYGTSAGFVGGNSIFNYQFSMLNFTDHFIQNYFGNNYETLKYNTLTGEASGVMALQNPSDAASATNGWVFGSNLNLWILKMNVAYYSMNGQPLAPILSAGGTFKLPVKNLPLEASAQYTKYKLDPNKFFDEFYKNSILEAKLIYPTPSGLSIEVDYTGYFDDAGILHGSYSFNTEFGW
jgi:hypothetical protein